MSKQCKVFNFEIKQVGNESERVLRFVGSDETPDRENDIIEATGWKLDDYLKNPVFLWAHDYESPPVGKAINVMIDAASKKLLFDIKFPTAEEYPFADTIYKLYKGGYLSATSVGFRGIKFKTRDDEAVLNLDEWRRGRRYMEQSLLELSGCPVPCNPNALVEVRSKGFKNEDIDKVFFSEKGAIPYKKYPLADEGEAWDGPAEIAAASVEDLKTMCAWFDSENADNKGAYKLPHHKQDGYTTVWRAVAAAMGALLGARGGVQLPEVDRKGVYNHLSKHYDDFGKTAPEFKDYPEAELKTMFPEEKSGSTLSNKNRQLLGSIHDSLDNCKTQLKEFLDGTMPMEPMASAQMTMPMESMMSAMRTMVAQEIKSALEDIKSQVFLLSQKDAPGVIDLDAIEWTPNKTTAAQDELNIEPGELKNMIVEIINNQLQGGI